MARRPVVQVDVAVGLAELAADVLWQGAPSAVAIEERDDGTVRLTADVEDHAVLTALPEDARVEMLDPDGADHRDAWRAWARPARAGRRIVLHPAWLPTEPADDDDVVILLDPGRAFGSGSHPSTRLCVAVLEDVVAPGGRVLDVGTGSGVLAITACVLGARAAVAIDVEPEALRVVPVNAAANGVTDRVDVSTESLAVVAGRFDLVVANIGAAVLVELAADLQDRVEPHGHLVLSGLLDEQVDDVVAHLSACTEVQRRHEDGWAVTVLRRAG